MDNQNKAENYNSYFLIPGLIAGVLTACIFTSAVGLWILGGVLGLIFAGVWMNVAMKSSEKG